jgi:hypothetical protein
MELESGASEAVCIYSIRGLWSWRRLPKRRILTPYWYGWWPERTSKNNYNDSYFCRDKHSRSWQDYPQYPLAISLPLVHSCSY